VGGGARGCALTPATIAHLLRAGVPLVEGMPVRRVRGGRCLPDACAILSRERGGGGWTGWRICIAGSGGDCRIRWRDGVVQRLPWAWEDAPWQLVPDLDTRLGFLAAVDEAERRGIERRGWSRDLLAWETTRAEMIEALARALGGER